jgi:hypothetical protein
VLGFNLTSSRDDMGLEVQLLTFLASELGDGVSWKFNPSKKVPPPSAQRTDVRLTAVEKTLSPSGIPN